MKPPRFRIAWIMVAVAIAALSFGAIRALLPRHEDVLDDQRGVYLSLLMNHGTDSEVSTIKRPRLRLSSILWLVALAAAFLAGIRYGEYRATARSGVVRAIDMNVQVKAWRVAKRPRTGSAGRTEEQAMRLTRMTTRQLMLVLVVVALLIVIVPGVMRELRRRYIIGSPATGRRSWEGDSHWIRFRGG